MRFGMEMQNCMQVKCLIHRSMILDGDDLVFGTLRHCILPISTIDRSTILSMVSHLPMTVIEQ